MRKNGSVTRYTLQRNTARIMIDDFNLSFFVLRNNRLLKMLRISILSYPVFYISHRHCFLRGEGFN